MVDWKKHRTIKWPWIVGALVVIGLVGSLLEKEEKPQVKPPSTPEPAVNKPEKPILGDGLVECGPEDTGCEEFTLVDPESGETTTITARRTKAKTEDFEEKVEQLARGSSQWQQYAAAPFYANAGSKPEPEISVEEVMDGSAHVTFEFTSQGIGIPNASGISAGPRFYTYEQWWENKGGQWVFKSDRGKPYEKR